MKRYDGDVVQNDELDESGGKYEPSTAVAKSAPPPIASRRFMRDSSAGVVAESSSTPIAAPAKTSAIQGKNTKLLNPATGTM